MVSLFMSQTNMALGFLPATSKSKVRNKLLGQPFFCEALPHPLGSHLKCHSLGLGIFKLHVEEVIHSPFNFLAIRQEFLWILLPCSLLLLCECLIPIACSNVFRKLGTDPGLRTVERYQALSNCSLVRECKCSEYKVDQLGCILGTI